MEALYLLKYYYDYWIIGLYLKKAKRTTFRILFIELQYLYYIDYFYFALFLFSFGFKIYSTII